MAAFVELYAGALDGDGGGGQCPVLNLKVVFFNYIFYHLLSVQHNCSSTQYWGSVLPSIVETRDQNSRGCFLLFSNTNLGSFCAKGTEILYTNSLWEVADHSRSKMHEPCFIITHDPGRRPGPESNLWISG